MLQGRVIGLDPGHGGIDKDNGWGFEGPVNLAVALELKRLLERDGARVVMSRMTDTDVPLAERPKKVELAGAEVFVSIHHNAIKNSDSNYTSTWYHGFPPKEPASLDLADCIQRRVRDALRTPLKVPTPVMTDRLMYKTGYRVLREAHVPAVLCEASFLHGGRGEETTSEPRVSTTGSVWLLLGAGGLLCPWNSDGDALDGGFATQKAPLGAGSRRRFAFLRRVGERVHTHSPQVDSSGV